MVSPLENIRIPLPLSGPDQDSWRTTCYKRLQSGHRMGLCNFEEFPVCSTKLCYTSLHLLKQEKEEHGVSLFIAN